jgi:hypothetical protein
MLDRVTRSWSAAVSILCAAGVVLVAVACWPDDTPAEPGSAPTTIRFANAAGDIGAIDAYDSVSAHSRTLVAPNVLFGRTDTTTVKPGTHWFDIALAGQATTVNAPPAPGSSRTLSGQSYDVIVLDSGATPVAFGQFLPVVLPDTISTNTKLRVVMGDKSLGSADIYANPAGTSFVGTSPVASALAFPLNTSGNSGVLYLSVSSGPTEVLVLPAGDTQQSAAVVDTTITLTANQALTAVVTPDPAVAGRDLLVVVRDH